MDDLMKVTQNHSLRILLLLFHLLMLAVIWGICLPRIANWAPVRNHISKMESSEVNVDAMFYTELHWHPGM